MLEELDDLRKCKVKLEHKVSQFQHEIKKKENMIVKHQEQLKIVIGIQKNKAAQVKYQNSIEMTDLVSGNFSKEGKSFK